MTKLFKNEEDGVISDAKFDEIYNRQNIYFRSYPNPGEKAYKVEFILTDSFIRENLETKNYLADFATVTVPRRLQLSRESIAIITREKSDFGRLKTIREKILTEKLKDSYFVFLTECELEEIRLEYSEFTDDDSKHLGASLSGI